MQDNEKNQKLNVDSIAGLRKIVLESIGEAGVGSAHKKPLSAPPLPVRSPAGQPIAEKIKVVQPEPQAKREPVKPRAMDAVNFLHPADMEENVKCPIQKHVLPRVKRAGEGLLNLSAKTRNILPKKALASSEGLKSIPKKTDAPAPEKSKVKKINAEKSEKYHSQSSEKKHGQNRKKIAQKLAGLKKAIVSGVRSYNDNFSAYAKKSLLIALIVFSVSLLAYFITVFSVIWTAADKPWLRSLSIRLPIPAMIVQGQAVNYYFWNDIKQKTVIQDNENLHEIARKNTARYIATRVLAKRYGLGPISYDEMDKDAVVEALAQAAVKDEKANQVAIKRIASIRKMIAEKKDFVSVSEKYGDELGQLTLNQESRDAYPIYSELAKLSAGEMSGIMTAVNGYYIYQCFDKNENEQVFSYVLVRSKKIEDLISDMAASYRFVSFVD